MHKTIYLLVSFFVLSACNKKEVTLNNPIGISNLTNTTLINVSYGNNAIVPVYQSQWMKAKLNKLNVTNEYHEYTAYHGFNNTQAADVTPKLVKFFKTNINE